MITGQIYQIKKKHGESIAELLKFLGEFDESDKHLPLWEALYNWSIDLTYCHGVIQLLIRLQEETSDTDTTNLLREAEMRLDYIIKDMRTGLGVKQLEEA